MELKKFKKRKYYMREKIKEVLKARGLKFIETSLGLIDSDLIVIIKQFKLTRLE